MKKNRATKRKIKGAFGALVLCWIFLTGILSHDMRASAATDSETLNSMIPVIFACDENGNPIGFSFGISIYTEDRGVVIVSSDAYVGTCSVYIMSFYTENGNVMEILEPFAASEEYKTVFFSPQADSAFTNFFKTGSMKSLTTDMELTQTLLSSDGEMYAGINYCVGKDGNFYKLAYSLEDVVGGAPLVEADLGIVGMIMAEGDGTRVVDMETVWGLYRSTVDSTGGSGGAGEGSGGTGGSGTGSGSSSGGIGMNGFWGVIVLVIVIVLVVLVYSYTKKNKGGGKKQAYTAPPAGGVSLMGISGIHAGAVFPLDEPLVMGRDISKCNLIFDRQTQGISGVHCQISPAGDGAQLMDMGSSYGTFLQNGTQLTPHIPYTLQKGDSFYLADRQYSYRIQ